jgi:hypothetical protein
MKMSLLMLVAGAVVAAGAVAAVASRKREVVTPSHPLAGSVDRRMRLFDNLAGQSPTGARPERRIDGDEYHLDTSGDGRAWAV